MVSKMKSDVNVLRIIIISIKINCRCQIVKLVRFAHNWNDGTME